ncbi:MAG: cyclic nucleotide-binding domain-containing protein, partial [Candidatus Brocadiae bacterium]|nr:cyclic nucleotide-binding domain-containing protein [Candidatus Brocadiia bacterium]
FLAAAAPRASDDAPAPPVPPPAPGTASGATEQDKTRARMQGIAARLKGASIFQGLPMEELERIAAAVKLVTYAPPTVLLKAGDPGEKYYLIVTGRVDVSKVDQDGTEKILSSLGAGQGVGEMSLLTGEKCSATVRVTETVQAMVLTRAEFEEMLEAAPELNRHFNRILADRLRSTNQKLTDVIQNGVLGKLSMFSLGELTQALTVSGRTGYLHLMHRNQRGFLTVRDGFVFNAKLVGKDRPEDAFLEMMTWREGEFRFEQSDISTLGLRPIDTTSLLMEGARRADEKARAAAPAGASPPAPTGQL